MKALEGAQILVGLLDYFDAVEAHLQAAPRACRARAVHVAVAPSNPAPELSYLKSFCVPFSN
ncbi:MAG TPA: hypothetical protein VJT13_14390 [Xanthobacteraceae bacterium]|nr:hypothetical protein [Xanthobacteraceae bacterium]